MEETKVNLGPESPADLEWSQGAKNPRKDTKDESDDDKFDIINIGPLDSDTDDDDNGILVLKDDDELPKEVTQRDDVTGTPAGDTGTSSGEQKRAHENNEDKTESEKAIVDTGTSSGQQKRALDNNGDKTENKKAKVDNGTLSDEQKRPLDNNKDKTESKKAKVEEIPTEYYLREKERRNLLHESERTERIDLSQKIKKTSSVHQKIYDRFYERIENTDPSDLVQEFKIRDYLVKSIQANEKVYSNFRKDPLTAIFCPRSNLGTVTRPQAQHLQNAIMQLLVEYYKPYRGDLVRFEDCIFDEGYFSVKCADLFSLQYLKTLSFQNVWPGSPKFEVITAIDFASMIDVSIVFYRNKFKDFKEFLKLIVFQNRDIDVRRWVYVRKELFQMEKWYLKIDAVSLRYIYDVGGKLRCGTELLEFKSNVRYP